MSDPLQKIGILGDSKIFTDSGPPGTIPPNVPIYHVERFRSHQAFFHACLGKPRLTFINEDQLLRTFTDGPPTRLWHVLGIPEDRQAWLRQQVGEHAFALCGVADGLSSLKEVERLRELITAPFMPYDALVCTSQAARVMVQTVTGTYSEELRQRFGGNPRLQPRLEVIPPGIDTEKIQPASSEQRRHAREALGIGEDEIAVLHEGLLSFHARAHPYPLFESLARAVRRTGRSVRLIFSGYSVNPRIIKAMLDGAHIFAPNVKICVIETAKGGNPDAGWQAADVFASLSDSVQEAFSTPTLEAMARGLPVVVSDWSGHRDQVVHGETGFLIPTSLIPGAAAEATIRYLLGEINDELFLGECSQAVVVDPDAATRSFCRLVEDATLQRRLGTAARRRAVEHFSWPHILRAHEELWSEQDAARRETRPASMSIPKTSVGPGAYPALETSFATYPTRCLEPDDRLIADEFALERLDWLLKLPLTNYAVGTRTADRAILRAILGAAKSPLGIVQLDSILTDAGLSSPQGRSTVAWMLKYGLLRRAAAQNIAFQNSDVQESSVTSESPETVRNADAPLASRV